MPDNKEYKVEVQVNYGKDSEENELLSFHVYTTDEKLARLSAVEKAKVWTPPAFHPSYEIKKIIEVRR